MDLNVGTRRDWVVLQGESPWFSYETCKQSSRYSFGGGAWDWPVNAPDFHGALDIEVFEQIFFFRTHR